jgi:hypothetical protein
MRQEEELMMKLEKLLTKKELAERWKVTEKAIDNWRKEGIITPCKGIPAIRFSLQHIIELEGTKLEKFSPLEKRRLEEENERLRKANEELKLIYKNIMIESSKVINFIK